MKRTMWGSLILLVLLIGGLVVSLGESMYSFRLTRQSIPREGSSNAIPRSCEGM